MSTTVQTAQQPAFHFDNLFAHPGSTLAGVGVVATTVATSMAAAPLPTSTFGWIVYALSLAGGIGAMLGK